MKKILIIQLMLSSSLMAEQGIELAIGKNRSNTCEAAKKKARETYNIFQMNRGCTCEKIDQKMWSCELVFSYMSKK